jgi:hypothetical protein
LLNSGGGQRQFLALPIFLFLAPFFVNAPGFRFALSALRFQLSDFQCFSFLLRAGLFDPVFHPHLLRHKGTFRKIRRQGEARNSRARAARSGPTYGLTPFSWGLV